MFEHHISLVPVLTQQLEVLVLILKKDVTMLRLVTGTTRDVLLAALPVTQSMDGSKLTCVV